MPEVSEQQSHAARGGVTRLCTDAWAERDRLAAFREHFGRGSIVVEPLPEEPFRIDVTLMKLPGLGIVWGRRSALRSNFADGHHRLMLSVGGHALAKQCGREITLESGDAIVLSGSTPGSLTTFQTGRIVTLEFPHDASIPALGRLESIGARRLPKQLPALRLLRGYLIALQASGGTSISALQPLAITHLYDLTSFALGALHDAEEVANGRGVRAARLASIKKQILESLGRDISLSEVAARHNVSSRYVRMLFESEGSSFTEFVREERLKLAHRMLLSRRYDHRRISDIAFDSGFNDLSYFNRMFRRRFGATPSDVRARGER